MSTGGPWEGDPGATGGLEGLEGHHVPGMWADHSTTHTQTLPTCPPGCGLGIWGVGVEVGGTFSSRGVSPAPATEEA